MPLALEYYNIVVRKQRESKPVKGNLSYSTIRLLLLVIILELALTC